MPSFVTHLESAIDGTHLDPSKLQSMHAGRPLWVRYDLEAIASALKREDLQQRDSTIWRYRELLPVASSDNIVSLGEGMSPLLHCERLGKALGLRQLYIKDESQLPTGSFKSRGLCLAVSMAKQLGVKRLAIPTAGNAGGAMAAYAARAGIEAYVFMPKDTPLVNRGEATLLGAKSFLVDGLITDCAAIVQAGAEAMGWFDLSTLKEPYRIEGKKTMGLELAEQMDWELPEAIFYPTGGGTGLIGMWKAFAELETLGWLENTRKPRMYACQSDGCAPIVTAYDRGERFAEPFPNPKTEAKGLRVPKAIGDFMILDAVRESGGAALAAPEESLIPWMQLAASSEGISLCPESAACLATIHSEVQAQRLGADERIVVFNTGAAQKYVEIQPADPPEISLAAGIDWDALKGGN